MSMRIALLAATGTIICLASAGCETEGPKPTDELTKAHTWVEQANKGGNAQRYAAADLQRAHDELADADCLSGQRKFDESRAYAQRAEVDADVAVARGNAMEQQKAAADVAQANTTLQQEIQRGDTNGPTHN
jgi:Domain of unknown function (DUF4398)